jgi:hypothetical protein
MARTFTFAAALRAKAGGPASLLSEVAGGMPELRPVDADYLLRVLPLEEDLRGRLEAFRLGRAPLYNADRAELRELVGDRLAAVGFDRDDRPTPEGRRLEELIDLLFTS